MSKPTYEETKEAVSYDPITGIFTRLSNHKSTCRRKVGIIPVTNTVIHIADKIVSLNQVAYMLMKKEASIYNLTHKDKDPDNYKWDNIITIQKAYSLPGKIKNKEHTEIIDGKKLVVDASPVRQPKTSANKMRLAGKCVGCIHYLIYCLENNMEKACKGRKLSNNPLF